MRFKGEFEIRRNDDFIFYVAFLAKITAIKTSLSII